MIRKISKLFTISTLGKLLGFVRIQLLTYYFGANVLTDAIILIVNIYWFWSNNVVNALFSNTLIPRIAKIHGEKEQLSETARTVNGINVLALLLIGIILLFSKFIIQLFAPGGSAEFLHHGQTLMYILIPLVVLIPITEIFTLNNQFHEKFTISAMNMAIWNTFQILAILIAVHFLNIEQLIWIFGGSMIISYSVTAYLQLRTANFLQYFSLRSLSTISFQHFKESVKSNLRYFLSTFFFQLNIYVNYAFISDIRPGAITIYNIITRIPDVIQSLMISTLSIIFFNEISKNKENTNRYFAKISQYLFLLTIGLALFARFFGDRLLFLLYGQHVFTDFPDSDKVLLVSMVNIFFFGKFALLIKTAIVRNKGYMLLSGTAVAFLLNLILNYILVKKFGMIGVVASTLVVNTALTFITEYFLAEEKKNLLTDYLINIMLIVICYAIYTL